MLRPKPDLWLPTQEPTKAKAAAQAAVRAAVDAGIGVGVGVGTIASYGNCRRSAAADSTGGSD
ncbi:hypothetical protein ACFVRB_13035 [Streptomyces nojiriensis]|uniref:hypothetical protein n=1 Tax=Streptomyces nojiriensis TaxID=66374 RepID=UPI0036D8FF5D